MIHPRLALLRRLPLLLLAALAAARPTAAASTRPPAPDGAAVVVLVRHAEKAARPVDDPPLTAAGAERARLLADLLRDVALDRILSTDYARTRQTAGPIATRTGLPVEGYDPRAPEALAERLRTAPGRRTLVVGHSNTIPELVRLLGGEPGAPIDEAAEHDRLYILTIPPSGPVTTILLRFGRPFEGGPG